MSDLSPVRPTASETPTIQTRDLRKNFSNFEVLRFVSGGDEHGPYFKVSLASGTR